MYDIYMVKNGDTIESISNKYNITPNILYQLNGLSPNFDLQVGKSVVVPKNTSVYFDYYTIKKGDNLYKIANKYDVDYNMLALINGLEVNDFIYPNQVIAVPKNGVKYYIVNEGDSLIEISKRLGATLEELINQNNNIYLLPEQLIVYREN